MSRTPSYRSNFDNCILFLNLLWLLLGFTRYSLYTEQSGTLFKSLRLKPLPIHQQYQVQYSHSHMQSYKIWLSISELCTIQHRTKKKKKKIAISHPHGMKLALKLLLDFTWITYSLLSELPDSIMCHAFFSISGTNFFFSNLMQGIPSVCFFLTTDLSLNPN